MPLIRLLALPFRAADGLVSAVLSRPRALRQWWRDQNQYDRVVPEDIRRLAKERGIPKPTVWIPSIEGRPARIPRDEDSAGFRQP